MPATDYAVSHHGARACQRVHLEARARCDLHPKARAHHQVHAIVCVVGAVFSRAHQLLDHVPTTVRTPDNLLDDSLPPCHLPTPSLFVLPSPLNPLNDPLPLCHVNHIVSITDEQSSRLTSSLAPPLPQTPTNSLAPPWVSSLSAKLCKTDPLASSQAYRPMTPPRPVSLSVPPWLYASSAQLWSDVTRAPPGSPFPMAPSWSLTLSSWFHSRLPGLWLCLSPPPLQLNRVPLSLQLSLGRHSLVSPRSARSAHLVTQVSSAPSDF